MTEQVALFGYDYTKDVGAGQTNFCLSLILLKLEDYQPPCHLQMELQNRDIYSVPRGFHQSEETIPHLGTLHKDMFLYQLLSTKGTRNPRVPLQIKRLSDPRKQFYAVQDLPLKRRKWEPRVTHVIASTNENGACKRTLKFMMGILEGKWILSIDWIKACMKDREYVSEELYEISIDVHGTRQGPFTGR
ncbi:hypothetical protein IGI04_002121 [Brassica rapa subsp. trilocularis]|uniref:BRCT domain-containing protein n=1 Tax=Brassica rapa subsp. trilocularis TaxID=1813537 RepID=A0ABQ7NXW5_BRACM|nr:hypothetical protein IGI04_002121 [Brassica rapa subsp. trilocularis]